MKFDFVFKRGLVTVARLPGLIDVKKHYLTAEDLEKAVVELPRLVEKLTGYRLHIEQDAYVDK